MSEPTVGSAGQAGSPAIGNVPTNPNALGGRVGQTSSGPNVDYEAKLKETETQKSELESKLGSQGRELGEYRTFFEGIAPLLDKLDKSPELVQAIIDGKVDSELAKAAMEGKISVGEAQVVTEAHAEVKKELGKKTYEAMTPEDISKLVEEKANAVRAEMDSRMKESEEMRDFERNVKDFIDRTSDFSDYAKEIDEWLDEHDTTDIEVAYYAVKGKVSEREAQKQAKEAGVEMAKNAALNASGGGSPSNFVQNDAELVDRLIAGHANPNVF